MSGSKRPDDDGGGGKFRKPPFRTPSTPLPEEGEHLPAVNPARSVEELGMALAPLKDLAEAFRQNAETLKNLTESQSRLSRKIDKSDRSEAVMQSTKALNDTFRGVQRTQERLLGRLDEEKKRPLRTFIVVVVVCVALVGGSLWILFDWLDRRDLRAGREQRGTLTDIVTAHTEKVEDLQEGLRRAKTDLDRQTAVAERAAEHTLDLSGQVTELEEIVNGLRSDQQRLTREAMQVPDLQGSISRLTGELEEAGRLLEEERRRRAELEAEVAELEGRLEAMARRAMASGPAATGSAPTPEVPAAVAPEPAAPLRVTPAEAAPAAEPGTSIPPGASTHPGALSRIASVLNRLLSEAGGEESYEFTKIGGARGRMIYDVEVTNFDASGQEVKRIQAGEARIVVDVPQRSVELRFKKGFIHYYGVRAPFWGGQYILSVVNVDPGSWLESGLTILEEVR